MLLKIEIPQNLVNQQLLRQSDIPCVCYIGKSFEVRFESPLTAAVGTVDDWDRKAVEERVPAGAGGHWTHCRHSRMTLRAMSDGIYEVRELAMFYEAHGWLPVIHDGVYAVAKEIWDEE